MRCSYSCLALIFATSAWLATEARAEPLQVDAALLRDAASLLQQEAASEAAAALPWAELVPAQNRSGANTSGGRSGSGVAVGLQVGTPTALTFKFGAEKGAHFVLGVGAGFGFRDLARFGLSLHGDYLFTVATLVNNGTISLDAYIGPGVWITLFNDAKYYGYFGGPVYGYGIDFFGLAARVPLGLSMQFTAAPIELYLELDPAIFVFPLIDGFIGASLGFRWQF